ncbi:MAG: cytochrome-c peroxidase [Cellvibrionaceae bacterium]
MLTRYHKSLIGAFIIFVGVMVFYYYLTQPQIINKQVITNTQYHHNSVKGAIQPIPTRIEFDQQWARLGKALFNSTLLSRDNTIACASCHLVNFGGDDGFPVSTGIDNRVGTRNSPTVLNAVFNFRQFWDGRSPDLADQVSGPVHNPLEMGSSWEEVIRKLDQEPQFKRAFLDVHPDGITKDNIIKAITIFEETLITPNAPIDRYLMGEKDALTAQQQRGYRKFIEFGCVTCHQGRNIGGNLYQKLGRIDIVPDYLLNDEGLFSLTQKPSDRYVFKVPSLRNVADTAPYFHNGSVSTLPEAVSIMAQIQLGLVLEQGDIDDIVALLNAFSSPVYQVKN